MSFGVFEAFKPAVEWNKLVSDKSSSCSSSTSSWLDNFISGARSSKDSSPENKVDDAPRCTAPKNGLYKFINSSKPADIKALEHRKIVRSQAAKLQPLEPDEDRAAKIKRRRRHNRSYRHCTFNINLRVGRACARAAKRADETAPQMKEMVEAASPSLIKSPDGGWPMPFAKLASRSQAFAPGLMHHYLTVLAVDIPELDLVQPGLLRSSWFPMALTEPATFQVILLTAASHFAMINSMQRATELLTLRHETLRLINDLLCNPVNACTDTAIAAVAKLASYEAQFGDAELYEIHMEGLLRMIMMRGGLTKLGLDGLLMRMLLWIDVNARHLINAPLFIASQMVDPGETLPPPNPAMYIGGV